MFGLRPDPQQVMWDKPSPSHSSGGFPVQKANVVVDVHAHFLLGAVNPEAAPTLSGPNLAAMKMTDLPGDVAERIRRMDDAGIDMQILMAGASYKADRASGVAVARAANEASARLVQAHPTRFAAYLSLPLPHIDAAIEEVARWAGDTRFVGILGHCSVLGRSIADAHFDPLYEELDERGSVVFLHPVVNGICSAFLNEWGLAASVGTSFEDTIAVLHLLIREVPTRFPKLKFILPHLGGSLAMLLPRLDGQLPWEHPNLSEAPSATAKRFFFDTVGHGSHAALRCAWEAFGAERLLAGSDFPFVPAGGYASTIEYIRTSGIPPEDVEKIIERNAIEIFKLR
jgi:predicted TIM-barrel fold metal-dependent hydrolase